MKYEESELLLEEDEDGFLDKKNDCYWGSPKDWLFSGILGGCACGRSEYLSNLTYEVLEFFSKELENKNYDWYYKGKEFYELIAHWLDSKDLIEHGTSIGGSWLTDYGRQVYETIKKYEKDK